MRSPNGTGFGFTSWRCAGFGFSAPQQIAATCKSTNVDGIVVASALIDVFEKAQGSNTERVQIAAERARELKQATKMAG